MLIDRDTVVLGADIIANVDERLQVEPGETVTLDLSGIGRYTKVMSGDAPNLEIFESIYREGMQPHEWLDTYLAKAL